MTQHIKPLISGLNEGHALYDDIQAFLEFGQLDKELVSDTALTTTAALVDDTDIGDARTFDATADAVTETVTITGACTILVVSRLLTGRAAGTNGNILLAYAEASGNNVTLQYEAFSPYKYRSINRANFSSTIVTNGDGFATDDVFDDGHAVAFTYNPNGTNKSCIDGTIGASSVTAPAQAYAGSPVLSFMSSIGSSASVNVGAIVVFDRALTDAELQSVTNNPWALTAVANIAPVIDTPEPDLQIPTGATVNVDFGATASDANDDEITVTVSPALPSGLTLSSAGVMTNTGALSVTAAADYTFTYDDGNGGTVDDVVNIEIVAAVFRVDSISDTTPEYGTTITVDHSNADGTITSGDYTLSNQTATQIDIAIPNPSTHILSGETKPTLPFEAPVTIPLADDSNTDDVELDGIQIKDGEYYVEITSVGGFHLNDTNAAIGNYSYVYDVVGNWYINPATGLVSAPASGGSFKYKNYNGEWSLEKSVTASARPTGNVSIDSVTPNKTSALIVFSYPGADVTSFQYNIGGSWIAATSPLTISGLTEETLYTLNIRPLNGTSAGSSTSTTFTTGDAVDTTPNPDTFTAIAGQLLNDSVVSNALAVLGVDAGVDIPITVSSGLYSYSSDGGQNYSVPTSDAGNLRLNYLFRAHHDTSGVHNTETTTTINLGGVDFVFTSTTLADAVSPVISLLDGNFSIVEGTTFNEPGYTATDNADGDITEDVVVTGSVNTAIPGTYILSYYVVDSVGNDTTVQRTITVTPEIVTTPMTQVLTPENISLDIEGEPGTEIKLFSGSNNRFKVTLNIESETVDLSVFSRLLLKLDNETSIDSDTDSGLDWSEGDGKITLDIGSYLTGSNAIETIMCAYRNGINTPYVLWHPSLKSKLRIQKIEL